MAFIGNDPGQLRNLAAQLNGKRGPDPEHPHPADLAAETTSSGRVADAARFRSEWTGQHTSQLRAVINALHDASRTATTNPPSRRRPSA